MGTDAYRPVNDGTTPRAGDVIEFEEALYIVARYDEESAEEGEPSVWVDGEDEMFMSITWEDWVTSKKLGNAYDWVRERNETA